MIYIMYCTVANLLICIRLPKTLKTLQAHVSDRFVVPVDDTLQLSFLLPRIVAALCKQGITIPVAFILKNRTETALSSTNATFSFIKHLFLDQNLNKIIFEKKERRGGSLAGLAFPKLTVDKQNHKVPHLCGDAAQKAWRRATFPSSSV